jgi:hypothetical protein
VEDVAYRVIAAQQQPDHATIARFRARHEGALAELFSSVLTPCKEAGLVKVGVIAIDGTKVHANASHHSNLGILRRHGSSLRHQPRRHESRRRHDGQDRLPHRLKPHYQAKKRGLRASSCQYSCQSCCSAPPSGCEPAELFERDAAITVFGREDDRAVRPYRSHPGELLERGPPPVRLHALDNQLAVLLERDLPQLVFQLLDIHVLALALGFGGFRQLLEGHAQRFRDSAHTVPARHGPPRGSPYRRERTFEGW